MNVVVTGGGTIAPIDDVRHIANTSSGRFSAEITESFLRRGATVWHVHGPGAVLPYHDRRMLSIDRDLDRELARLTALRREVEESRARLHCRAIEPGTVSGYGLVLREILTGQAIDVAVLAMAASDYEPDRMAGKTSSDRDAWTITLRRAPKVIRSVKDWAPGTFLVGFKLLYNVSDDELIATARAACERNRADLTVANDLLRKQQGLHTVHLVDRDRLIETIGPGESIADQLVEGILAAWAGP